MLGKLSWSVIPFQQPLPLYAMGVVGIIILAVLGVVTKKGWCPYLWREWLTSVDHKQIGVMYLILALVMLLRGFSDAIMMRSQQAIAIGGNQGYLPPDHYDQIFSSHGTIMIFFVAMPFVVGLINFVVPLQLGARDVAFPVLNSVSFWLSAVGALLINVSLVIGISADRLDGLSAAIRARLSRPMWASTITFGSCRSGHRHLVRRRQHGRHHHQIALPGDDLFPHAGILLERADGKHVDCRRLSDPDGELPDAAARSLRGHALLHQ